MDDDGRFTPAPYQQVSDTQRSLRRTRATRRIVVGTILLLGGILVTSMTYSHPFAGGLHIVAFGPMVVGACSIGYGLWARNRS